MGITIHQAPTGYTSAHEEVWHVVESTDKNIVGFQYVYDIYKGAELLTRVKNSPLGADKLGVLDVGNIVRSSLDSYNFPQIQNGFALDVQLGTDVFFTDYDILYGQVSGVSEVSGNLASGTYRVYNNYRRSKWDKVTSDISGIVGVYAPGFDGRILTNRPTNNSFYSGEPIVMSMFVDDNASLYARSLYIDGSYVTDKQYNTSGQFNYAYCFSWFPSGTVNHIEVSLDPGGVTSTFQDFYFNKKCSKYETHTLVFLNAYGVYDSFTFVHGKLMMSNEKKKFEQQRWALSGNSMVEKSGAVYNESMKTYAVKYKEKMMLTSDILSTSEYNWLSELINSPQVYYYSTENSEYYPVQITDSDYEFKDDRINKAETLSVNIEFSIPQNTQYR